MRLSSDKPANIRAGLDIFNLSFSGQNLYRSDITTIAAGRDILDPRLVLDGLLSTDVPEPVPALELGGPGTLAISAGRNIGPLTSVLDARSLHYLVTGNPQYPGIRTVGNTNNLYLQRDGAAIALDYGVAPGINLDQFTEAYINPANRGPGSGRIGLQPLKVGNSIYRYLDDAGGGTSLASFSRYGTRAMPTLSWS